MMDESMVHFVFLIEDMSSEILITKIMDKIKNKHELITYECKSFHGIGGFTKKNTVKETKTGKLLNDLATYLRGFNKSLKGISAAVFVVLDNDDHDTDSFRKELDQVAIDNEISVDYVFCIAIEEVEAWLLGDRNALKTAYPEAKDSVLNAYKQDSICGTWEILAGAIAPKKFIQIKNRNLSYAEIGKMKCEWADRIGEYIEPERNSSQSFQLFINEVYKRVFTVS